jgi:hypothetical protein
MVIREQTGMSWPYVAIRVGRGAASLMVAVSKYQRGAMRFSTYRKDLDADADSIVSEMVREDISLREVARRRGRAPGSVHRSLARRGWDAETISELKQEIAA